ncbi:MAG: transcription termination factor Rho [Chthoniobacterales bacterium]|nr:MAG: transcription termination factor Rho [Chthoniobacterales bacterium]
MESDPVAAGAECGDEASKEQADDLRQQPSSEENRAGISQAEPIPARNWPPLDINELHKLSPGELVGLGEKSGVYLHPARSRHYLIVDLVRAALDAGATVTAQGFVDQSSDGFVLRCPELNFLPVPEDVSVPRGMMQEFQLRLGQRIGGVVKLRQNHSRLVLNELNTVENAPLTDWTPKTDFEQLTPQYPQGRIMLENDKTKSLEARAVDLLAPLGRGQRGLIVAPPRVGKTILLKEIAKAIRVNHPEIELIILLVDERPEEVTDLEREVDCQIYSSTFDEDTHRHVQVAELVLERAKRLVELKKDVVILLDSITRLARGYNNLQPSRGRIMSGGVESKALMKPKKFFGAARNVEEGGSLTIVATALIDTGSRMDEVIFEEFKGTGNMELHLDRGLVEKRMYPAIHVLQTATRREDLLYHPDEWERVQVLRKTMAALPPMEAMEMLISNLQATKTNAELLLAGLR